MYVTKLSIQREYSGFFNTRSKGQSMQGTNWGQAFEVFLYGFSGVFFCLIILLMGVKIFSKISVWAQETFGKKKEEEEVKVPAEYDAMQENISTEAKLPEYVFSIPDSFVEYPIEDKSRS